MFKKRQKFLVAAIILGFFPQMFFASVALAAFIPQGIVTSNNLISGNSASSISNFHYNISSLPGDSSVKIQFSLDNSSWYSSAGVSNAWDNLSSLGGGDLNLAALAWSSSSFYYKLQLNATSDLSQTPKVEDIRLDYVLASDNNVFVFDNSGNVGIGTTTPNSKLEVNGGVRLNTITAKPTCDTTHQGTLWFTKGSTGVKDTLEVCAKDGTDAYGWRTLY